MTDYSVYLVADTAVVRRAADQGIHALTLPQIAALAVENGVHTVQLRAKDCTAEQAEETLRQVAVVTEGRATLLLNDFVGSAARLMRAGVPLDGVHMGQSDGSPAQARELLGPDAIIGLTANQPEHLEALARLPRGTVDAIGIGTVRRTTTKDNPPAPKGFDGLADFLRLAEPLRRPGQEGGAGLQTVAIGGLGPGDAAAVQKAGADGMAVVSAICAAPDPGEVCRRLRAEWDTAWGRTPGETEPTGGLTLS